MNSANNHKSNIDSQILQKCNTIKIITDSGDTTNKTGKKLGSLIARQSNPNYKISNTIALYGGLGAGKTTFVQGFARGIGVPKNYYITSPTYNIINEYIADANYSLEQLKLYHIDLYRISSVDELEYIGFDDVMASDNRIVIIEWPDIVAAHSKYRATFDMEIRINIDQNYNREISFTPYRQDLNNLLVHFKNSFLL